MCRESETLKPIPGTSSQDDQNLTSLFRAESDENDTNIR